MGKKKQTKQQTSVCVCVCVCLCVCVCVCLCVFSSARLRGSEKTACFFLLLVAIRSIIAVPTGEMKHSAADERL